MIVIPGPASKELGLKIAEILGAETVNVEFKYFPDGESYIRFESDLKREDTVIIQSTYPPQDRHLIQLFMLADTARSLGARKIIAVVPYLAYSRQDKVFRPYEAVSIKTVLKLLQSCGVKHLIALNVHEPKVFEGLNFTANNLSAFPLLTEYLVNQNLSGAFSASPDKKALQMAVEADKVLGGGHGFFSKERDKVTGEIKMSLGCDFDVKGKNVIVFDDMISSGKTTAMAIKKLKEMGAKRVFSACIHALLVGDAYEKIINAGAEAIFSTDTIPSRVSVVSVAPVIAEFLKGKQPE